MTKKASIQTIVARNSRCFLRPAAELTLGTKDKLSLDGRSGRSGRALLKDSEHPSEKAALGFFRVQLSHGESVVFEGERPGRLEMG